MEEIISQFHGHIRVVVYKIKRKTYIKKDIINTYLDCEKKAVKLLYKLTEYKDCAFLICYDKKGHVQVPLDKIFNEVSSDICLIQEDNYLFIQNFGDFNLALLGGDTSIVIYPQGIEKIAGSGRSSYEYFYYFAPIISLIIFLYIIERRLERKEINKRLLI